MGANKTLIVLVIGALVLFVLLFIAPKTLPSGSNLENVAKPSPLVTSANLEVYVNMAVKALEPSEKGRVERLVSEKKADSLVLFWDKLKRPDLASFYSEEFAKNTNLATDWKKAGDRYYYAVPFSKDNSEAPVMYLSAIRCYGKVLDLDPKNTDAKIMLASCYVEGTDNPMEGISKLREVEKTDSNNVKLQLAFAFFSVKSGQFDRAISRFNKVLSVDSNYIEAYLHLADAYERKGETAKTIESLERYAATTSDITAKLEVEKYIKQLKQQQ
ncbi:MAG: tetratricopeptide repeat protein [Bacteroidia bacterium]|nr:tetratricopeptide repeat protein [Bacteroidia bacterium]